MYEQRESCSKQQPSHGVDEVSALETLASEVLRCVTCFVDALKQEFPCVPGEIAWSSKGDIATEDFSFCQQPHVHSLALRVNLLWFRLFGHSLDMGTQFRTGDHVHLLSHLLIHLMRMLSFVYKNLDFICDNSISSGDLKSKHTPAAPPGLLSIQSYANIACFVEFAVFFGILRNIPEPLYGFQERRIPRALSGRLSKRALAWSLRFPFGAEQERLRELIEYSASISELLLLERFRPMLLPRHVADIYLGFVVAEKDALLNPGLVPLLSVVAKRLALPRPPGNIQSVDDYLQAMSCQKILARGRETPAWLRKRVASMIDHVACRNLEAIFRAFCPSMTDGESQRLGFVVASAISRAGEIEAELFCVELVKFASHLSSGSATNPLGASRRSFVAAILCHVSLSWCRDVLSRFCFECFASTGTKTSLSMESCARFLSSLFAPSLVHVVPWIKIKSVLFRPLGSDKPVVGQKWRQTTIFAMIVRAATLRCAVQLNVRDAAKQMVAHYFKWLERCSTEQLPRLHIPSCMLDVLNAIAPCQYDFNHRLVVSSGGGGSAHGEVVRIEKRLVRDSILAMNEDIEARALVIVDILQGTVLHSDQPVASVASALFRTLIREYFKKTHGYDGQLDSLWLSSMIMLPILCEKASPASLLGDAENSGAAVLETIKTILQSASLRAIEVKAGLGVPVSDADRRNSIQVHDEILLGITGVALTLFIALLEIGASQRSADDECHINEIRRVLIDLTDCVGHIACNPLWCRNRAQIAELGAYAVSLAASRQSSTTSIPVVSHDTRKSNLADELDFVEQRLCSTQAPLRAQGMVMLRRIVYRLAGCFDAEKQPSVVLDEYGLAPTMRRLLDLAVRGVGDGESFVFLAAIQAVVALGDLEPDIIIPILLRLYHSRDSHHVLGRQISLESRIKLCESLIFVIRRRPSTDSFVGSIISTMLFGEKVEVCADNTIVDSDPTLLDGQASDAPSSDLSDGASRHAKAFVFEEPDAVEAGRIMILVDLVNSASPFCVAGYMERLSYFCRSALESSKSTIVVRAAALLARDLYSLLAHEGDLLTEGINETRSVDLPCNEALSSSEEMLLCAGLRRVLSRSQALDDRLADSLIAYRCTEALSMRRDCIRVGVFKIGSLLRAEKKAMEHYKPMMVTEQSDVIPVGLIPRLELSSEDSINRKN